MPHRYFGPIQSTKIDQSFNFMKYCTRALQDCRCLCLTQNRGIEASAAVTILDVTDGPEADDNASTDNDNLTKNKQIRHGTKSASNRKVELTRLGTGSSRTARKPLNSHDQDFVLHFALENKGPGYEFYDKDPNDPVFSHRTKYERADRLLQAAGIGTGLLFRNNCDQLS
jgi:hypothetical protein